MELSIGDLVQCRENHTNRALGIVERIGMVAELRRKDFRILFDVDDQSIWLSKLGVNRVTLPPTDRPTLLDRLSWLIHFVGAIECELERDEAGNYDYRVVCRELVLEQIVAVREAMGEQLVDLRIIPRGMSRLALQVVFRRETASA